MKYNNFVTKQVSFQNKHSYLYMSSGYKLYTFFKSSTAWRARIALNLKNIKPESIYIHLFKGDQKSDAYLKLNPNHGVPTLITPDGTVIIQSMAIIQYLNEVHKDPHDLFPGNPENRARIRGFCQVINSGIHPYQNLRLVEKISKDFNGDKVEWSKFWTTRGVSIIQKMLEINSTHDSKYVFGNNITAADVLFYPQVLATKLRWGVDLSPYPNVSRILNNLQSVKQFKDAQPTNQPDYDQ